MKLSTLLLSSAALLVAGAAVAADLPAKKAAKAAATGCSSFGDGYIAIPGSDTCLKISGYVAYEAALSGGTYGQDGYGRVGFDAKSNTEIGVVHSFYRINAYGAAAVGTTPESPTSSSPASGVFSDRAYIEFAGFQAGLIDSITDIGGTQSWWGAAGRIAGGGFTTAGVNYTAKFGNTSLTLGEENPVTDSYGYATNRPDLIAKVSTKSGAFSGSVAAVSHAVIDTDTGDTGNGYALLGQVQYTAGNFGLIAFGGTSQGALHYTSALTAPASYGDYGLSDFANGSYSKGTNFGGAVNATFGKNVVEVAVENTSATDGSNWNGVDNTVKNTYVDAWASFPVAKGLSVQPEYIAKTGDSSSNTAYLFIVRDF